MNKLMSFPEIVPELKSRMPELRGRLLPNQPLADLTWFRVGGLAQALFMPESEDDLAYFLAHVPTDVPATVIGLGSNLIVRDGGVPGVVIRLGRGFNDIKVEGNRVRAGTAAPDLRVAKGARGRSRRPCAPLHQRRDGLHLPPLRRAGRCHLHASRVRGRAGRSGRDRR